MVTLEAIIDATAEEFGITRTDILGMSRRREYVEPRQIAYALGHDMAGLSLPDVGRAMNGRDHTTVLHGVRRYRARHIFKLADRIDRIWKRVDPDIIKFKSRRAA